MPHPCRFCFASLTNGREYCGIACEDGDAQLYPWLVESLTDWPEEEPPVDPYEFVTGMPPIRSFLDAPPQPHEAAPLTDRLYLSGSRLRQNIAACNP